MKPSRILSRVKSKKSIKDAKAKIKGVERRVSGLPEECTSCSAHFDKNDRTLLDTWMITATEDKVSLYCPICFKTAKNGADL